MSSLCLSLSFWCRASFKKTKSQSKGRPPGRPFAVPCKPQHRARRAARASPGLGGRPQAAPPTAACGGRPCGPSLPPSPIPTNFPPPPCLFSHPPFFLPPPAKTPNKISPPPKSHPPVAKSQHHHASSPPFPLQNHQPFPIIFVHLQKSVRCKNAACCKSATNFVCKNATKRYNDNRKPHNSIPTEELI